MGNDEIREYYYDLEEFVDELSSISRRYDGKIGKNYLDLIDEIFCDADNEREALQERVQQIENAENEEQRKEDWRLRF